MTGAHEFSKEEIAAVKEKFPGLRLTAKGWEGDLAFYASFEDHPIRDTYRVAIDIPLEYPEQIPLLREIGGRTQKIAKKYGLQDIRSLHFNANNGTACVCVKQEEKRKFPPGAPLLTFIDDLAVPYLYGLSYYDQNGRWPWREYSHGCLGLLEFYAEAAA